MKIIVEIKNVYGKETIYPACDQSKLLADLAGNKTITVQNLSIIKKLGYQIEVKQQTI